MVLTIRGAYADIFWFSLFHELGHIVNGDVSKGSRFIDTVDNQNIKQENAADTFASNALLNEESYLSFVEEQDFTLSAISNYGRCQPPCRA